MSISSVSLLYMNIFSQNMLILRYTLKNKPTLGVFLIRKGLHNL